MLKQHKEILIFKVCVNKSSSLSLLASFIVAYGPVVINSQNCAGVEPRENSGCWQ